VRAVRVPQNLNAVVEEIADDEVALMVKGAITRMLELTVAAASAAKYTTKPSARSSHAAEIAALALAARGHERRHVTGLVLHIAQLDLDPEAVERTPDPDAERAGVEVVEREVGGSGHGLPLGWGHMSPNGSPDVQP
jgi:hypothetical protein